MALKSCTRYIAYFVAVAIIAIPVTAQKTARNEDLSSCRHFAQTFYRWYVPFTQKDLNRAASDIALEHKASAFAPALFRALKADSDAQRRAKGEIVGIDFDPFVGSQDPAEHYETRKIMLKDDRCFVEVWRNSPNDNSAKSDKPDVIAELSHRRGHWQFENFHYPDLKSDLMTELATLRKERGEQQ